ncbi:transposase zinc-binding domain-containing protein, partial [Nitrincola alkalisediminis]
MPNRLLQSVFRAYRSELDQQRQPLKNRKAIDAITACRSPEMGVSTYRCAQGHDTWEHYHSCRHRSCYLCAEHRRVEWIEKQKKRLLAVPHFHCI